MILFSYVIYFIINSQSMRIDFFLRNYMSHSKKAWYLRHVKDEYVKKAQI